MPARQNAANVWIGNYSDARGTGRTASSGEFGVRDFVRAENFDPFGAGLDWSRNADNSRDQLLQGVIAANYVVSNMYIT